MLSADYAQAMKSVSDIAIKAYTNIEMQFLKTHPEVVGREAYFKPFEPFFKNGLENVNWNLVEEKMQEILKSLFIFDTSNLNDEIKNSLANVAHILITIKDFPAVAKAMADKQNKLLGFISFLVAPECEYGDIKCIVFAVSPEEQNRGLGKILMSSIFKIIPSLKRIFLCTRRTNQKAQKAYYNWGFVEDKNPVNEEHGFTFNLDHWIFMEYKKDQSDLLQKTTDSFVQ